LEDTKMSEAKKNNELTTAGGFAALANNDVLENAAEDLAGLTLTLTASRSPQEAATAFEIPGDGDETEMVKEVKGVILLHHPAYAYYTEKYSGGSNPPDCGSFDGVHGHGQPRRAVLLLPV
jgi:hypothetical protein